MCKYRVVNEDQDITSDIGKLTNSDSLQFQ